jgi:hypothetical protein
MIEDVKSVVFANPVKDLTIARYLAAMDVEFFGIDLDDPDERKIKMLIHQIREWVEGPKLIGVSAMPPKNIAELFPLDGYYLDVQMEFSVGTFIFQSHHFYLNNPHSNHSYIIVENHNEILENQNCLLKSSIYEEPVQDVQLAGYMINPGKEVKVGLYDFEKLDDWFAMVGR